MIRSVSEPAGSGGAAVATAPPGRPGVAAPCPLQEPGILLSMIAVEPPSPTFEPAPSGRSGGGLAPGMVGAAAAAAALAAITVDRAWLPFAAAPGQGWTAAALLALLGAMAARRAIDSGRAKAWVAAAAVVLLASAAAALGLAGAGGSGVACLLLAPAIGAQLAIAVPRGQAWLGLGVWLGAAILLGGWWWAGVAAAPAELLAAALLLQLVAWFAVVAAAVPAPAPRRRTERLQVGALLALALLVVPAALVPSPTGAASSALLMATVAVAAAVGRSSGLAVAGAALAVVAWWGPVAAADSPAQRLVAAGGGAAVIYQRDTQQLQLQAAGLVIEVVGADRVEVPLLSTLLQALAAPGDRVLVLGPARGAAATALRAEPSFEVDAVETRPATAPLQGLLRGHGPVLPPPQADAAEPAPRARTAGLFPALAGLGVGSRQVVVVAEPNGAPWAGYAAAAEVPDRHVELHEELRRIAGDGLVLQVLALDLVPPSVLRLALTAAAASHPWAGLFVVGDAAVVVGAASRPDLAQLRAWSGWSSAWRWTAHQAHLGEATDLQRALLGTLRTAPAPSSTDASGASGAGGAGGADGGRRGIIAVLHELVVPWSPPPASPRSVLTRWSAQRAELRAAEQSLRGLPDDPGGRAAAQDLAARWLPLGTPTALLQAALGLSGTNREPLVPPAAASRRAHALAPLLFQALPPVLRSLPLPLQEQGALEDLSRLPPPARLAVLASGDAPLAIALRARFPSPCAQALVQALAAGPLPAAGMQALRELADPLVLAEAATVLAARGGGRELLALWRHDLPMPAALAGLLQGCRDDRRALAAALRGRREPSCHGVLADLLEAGESELRLLAAEALWHAVGERVPYDPDWPQSARAAAAQQLRSLHNQKP